MKTANLVAQRLEALNRTERRIKLVEEQNTEGQYNKVLTELRNTETRQRAAYESARQQLELFGEE